jgi:hypothetical protein
MFRLIKLFAYATLGYVIYELYQGRAQGGGGGGQRSRGRQGGGGMSEQLHEALNQDAGRMRMTGPGRGELLTTEDDAGTSVPHAVGRGVVQH